MTTVLKKSLLVIILSLVGLNLSAQASWAGWTTPEHSIDTDIAALRNNINPNFSYSYDDYIQYAPLALTLVLKACNYESRDNWGRMLTSQAFSALLTTGVVNGLKYSVQRGRPDGSRNNSFPSGHTATAFMAAQMLHKEYGWRSPWWSFGGYAVATAVALSRNMNNRHWVTDTWAGALIGIGATELGYWLTDLIFKDKGLSPNWSEPEFSYCSCDNKIWSVGPVYSRRFVLGRKTAKADSQVPYRGSNIALQFELPLAAGAGLAFRATAGSLIFKDENSFNIYGGQLGMFWEREFAKVLEIQAQGLIGYAGYGSRGGVGTTTLTKDDVQGGIDLTAGLSLNLITGLHSKVKAIVEWDTQSYANAKYAPESVPSFINSIFVGTSAVFYW